MSASAGGIPDCCLTGFAWGGTPSGTVTKLANNNSYVVGNNPDRAILYIHDLLGWEFPNARLIADHLASEVNATVFVPNFFDKVIPWEPVLAGDFQAIDLPGFAARNSRQIREPEIFACARALKSRFQKVGAIGYCFGGWAVFRLGAKENNGELVDAISTAHPSWLTKEDIDNVAVPVQLLAPEKDGQYTQELKEHTFKTLMAHNVPFDYRHFPGVEHACMTRGDPDVPGEREAQQQGKDAAVAWFKQYIC